MRRFAAQQASLGMALSLLALSIWPTEVRADAIDGDWCFGAQTLTIRGSQIRTPAGTDMSGKYGRHDFDYVVPANEAGAGGEISMRLQGEELMTLVRSLGGTISPPETWRRCKPVS
jgi:hypothetical protein